jgi:signal transduction histidine kinase
VPAALPLLRHGADRLLSLVERLHTFQHGLDTIGDSARQVARIVDGLKTYSHLDQARVEEADLHRSLQVTLAVLAPRIPPGVKVETRFATLAPFPHRPGELIQVWTNLVDNALHAMGDAGTLVLETHDAGDAVRVSIADTGAGVPPELGDRIFDLDVTTRGPGAGLGFGLAICKSLVEKSHGGSIDFESRPGHTVFTVILPKRGTMTAPSPSRP